MSPRESIVMSKTVFYQTQTSCIRILIFQFICQGVHEKCVSYEESQADQNAFSSIVFLFMTISVENKAVLWTR